MNDFVNRIVKKNINLKEDRDFVIFKILMDIHSCHEKLKSGIFDKDPECVSLYKYYLELSSEHTPSTTKLDVVFHDCRDIPQVYSMEMDEVFPLIQYPHKLYLKYRKNIDDSQEEGQILKYLDKARPQEFRDYINICRLLNKLEKNTLDKLQLSNFFK